MAPMPKKPEPTEPRRPKRRAPGMRALGTLLPAVAKTAFKQGGHALAALATDWDFIVGPELGRQTLPIKLAFAPGERRGGTLHIAASGALALELQHLEVQVLERVNGHFGYRAVERIRLVQDVARIEARLRRRAPPSKPRGPAPPVDGVDDPDLRAALERLGQALTKRP